MGKPKVVLADTDEKYIMPLELKFIKELDEEIDLYVITDKNYFQEYFEKPQSVDIIVVSDDLYSDQISKQDIKHVFVLSEVQNSEDETKTEAEIIFKYSNSNEIFNHIVSVGEIDAESQKEKETKIILFCSAKGGTGKTSTSLGISGYLSKLYKKVLYINAEQINTFQEYIRDYETVPIDIMFEFARSENKYLFNRIRHIIKNTGFDYMPPFEKALVSYDGMNMDVYRELILSAKALKEYDYIIIDTDHVFDAFKADLLTIADMVFLISKQDSNSAFAVETLFSNMNCKEMEKYYFICNMFEDTRENALSICRIKVSEYIKYDSAEGRSLENLINSKDIQRVAHLIM